MSSLPGHLSPSAGFEAPFEMLAACHERVERMLALLARLQRHLSTAGRDEAARQAARDVMRYFDLAAPLHHEDEERHVFPPLLSGNDPTLRDIATRLTSDHRQMERAWVLARSTLADIADQAQVGRAPLSPRQTRELDHFASLYQQHLLTEDQLAYPAAQGRLTPSALQAMSEDMMQRRGVKLQR